VSENFFSWVRANPEPARAQVANLRLFWDSLSVSDRLLIRALSPLALRPDCRGVEGPLGEAFSGLLCGPRAEPWGRVLARAKEGDYPLEGLRLLLLQERARVVSAGHLRRRVFSGLGIWPKAGIYILPAWAYRARAAELGFPIAFYRPDSIYAEEGVSEEILLHELVHSAQYQSAGSVERGAEPLALAAMEALTEEWSFRHGGGNLYEAERKILGLSELPLGTITKLLLLPIEEIADYFSSHLSKKKKHELLALVS
jgi:hypothetical protein